MLDSATPTIASGAIAKFFAMLPMIGLEPGAVCEAAGADPSVGATVDARVPLPVMYALWEVVLARVSRPDLALLVAQSYAPGDYGLMGFVLASSTSIGEALAQAERYTRLWTDEPRVHLRPDGKVRCNTARRGATGRACTARSNRRWASSSTAGAA